VSKQRKIKPNQTKPIIYNLRVQIKKQRSITYDSTEEKENSSLWLNSVFAQLSSAQFSSAQLSSAQLSSAQLSSAQLQVNFHSVPFKSPIASTSRPAAAAVATTSNDE